MKERNTEFWVFSFVGFLVCLALVFGSVMGISSNPKSPGFWTLLLGTLFLCYLWIVRPVQITLQQSSLGVQESLSKIEAATPETQYVISTTNYLREYQKVIEALKALNSEQIKFALELGEIPKIEISGTSITWKVADVDIPAYFAPIWYEKYLERTEGQLPADRDFAGLPDRDLLRSYNRAIRTALSKLGMVTNVEGGTGSRFPARFLVDPGKALRMIGFPIAYNVAIFLDYMETDTDKMEFDFGEFDKLPLMKVVK